VVCDDVATAAAVAAVVVVFVAVVTAVVFAAVDEPAVEVAALAVEAAGWVLAYAEVAR